MTFSSRGTQLIQAITNQPQICNYNNKIRTFAAAAENALHDLFRLTKNYNKMPTYLEGGKLQEIFKEYGGSEKNTGSTEAQIALFTFKIAELSEHLKSNRKDHSCRRSLLKMVGKRRRLLNYLSKRDLEGYRALLVKLGLRR